MALQLVREDAFKSLCCSSAPCPRVDALVAADAWGPHLLEPPEWSCWGRGCMCRSREVSDSVWVSAYLVVSYSVS